MRKSMSTAVRSEPRYFMCLYGNADIKELGTTVDNVHNAWKGKALAVVRASHLSGKVKIKVSSPDLTSAVLTLKIR